MNSKEEEYQSDIGKLIIYLSGLTNCEAPDVSFETRKDLIKIMRNSTHATDVIKILKSKAYTEDVKLIEQFIAKERTYVTIQLNYSEFKQLTQWIMDGDEKPSISISSETKSFLLGFMKNPQDNQFKWRINAAATVNHAHSQGMQTESQDSWYEHVKNDTHGAMWFIPPGFSN